MVTLGNTTQHIDQIWVWGRTDCCVDRINGFQVYVGSTIGVAGSPMPSGLTKCTNPYLTVGSPPAIIDANVAGCSSGGQYLFVQLPGQALLSLIEVRVYQKKPWVWRHLSGVAEVAQGKPSYQSSTELCCAGGDAHRGNDGSTSNNNYNQGSCTHTNDNQLQPLNEAWWQVDLQYVYDVVQVQFWPRTDCCQTRGTRYNIALGQSIDYMADYQIPKVQSAAVQPAGASWPGSVIPTLNAATVFTFNLPTPVATRFATVWRTFLLNDDNILNVCEFKVFANLLRDMPSPRYGSATAAYAGTILVFGGTDANGFLLNDMRVFDPVNVDWLPAAQPLGLPPPGRSSASLLVLGANGYASLGNTYKNSLALFGGVSATNIIGDVYIYGAATCQPLDMVFGMNAGSLGSGDSGTYTTISCNSQHVSTNNGVPLVCDATTGLWQGLYSLATGVVCVETLDQPDLNLATVNGVNPINSSTYSVSFSLNGAPYALISAAPEPDYFNNFNDEIQPADFNNGWAWQDTTTTKLSAFNFQNYHAVVYGALGATCSGACPAGPNCINNCPSLTRAFPSSINAIFGGGVDPKDYYFEALVSSDSNTVQPGHTSAIGLFFDHGGVNTYTLSLYAGIRVITSAVDYGSWQVGYSTPDGVCSYWITWVSLG